MRKCILFMPLVVAFACTSKEKVKREIIRIDHAWLDSITRKSDTSWIKPYRNNEQVTAEYYVDRKDSIVTQLMKDSAGNIRQITIAKYDQVRLFFAEYYSNGQMMARLPLDNTGNYNGEGRFYFEDGRVKSTGQFAHGFYTGEWKNYNKQGVLLSIDIYDENGQLITTKKMNE